MLISRKVKLLSQKRKAKPSDLEDIYNMVNEAYKVELGNKGISFKSTNRYENLDQAKANMDMTWVIRNEAGNVIACITCIVTDGLVFVGPLAVHPSHQVCTLDIVCSIGHFAVHYMCKA